MKTVENHNNFLAYLLLLISLFVLFFITRNVYGSLQVSLDTYEQSVSEEVQLREQLSELNTIKNQLAEEGNPIALELKPYLSAPSEQDILQYFYDYASQQNAENDVIVYRNIRIEEAQKNDIGFHEVQINISGIFAGESTLFSFLNMLISPESPYRFFISHFDYPMNEGSGNIQAEIPLVMYFK